MSGDYDPGMPAGNVTAFFMFDVGDAIDLPQLAGRVDRTVASRLATKPPTPIYLQYQQPPLTFDASALGVGDVNGFPVRVKAFDYGVLSLAVTRPLPESWDEAFAAGLEWQDNAELAQAAEQLCREMLSRIQATVSRPRDNFLSEDYVVFTVHPENDSATAEQLLALRGGQIAQLLRAERTPLSAQEHEEVLRHRISYYQTDVVIPTWSSAFVYDTGAGAAGVLEILEFANSQLLEFRYYDQLLDAELARTYASLQHGGWRQTWLGRHHARAARQIHAHLHRRQRVDRPGGERTEDRRRRLRGAHLRPDCRAPRPRSMERQRPREAEDRRRHLSLHGRADLDGARRVPRADHRPAHHPRAHPSDALRAAIA